MNGDWIDITIPLGRGLPRWPGDPEIGIETTELDYFRVTALRMSAHAGTHMDAPRHFYADGPDIATAPADAGIGEAKVIRVDGPVTAAALRDADIATGDRILFRTRNSQRRWMEEPFRDEFDTLLPDAAELLAARRVRLVGVDAMSVDVGDSTAFPVHKILMSAGVWIVESLDLCAVEAGRYDLFCLPLKIPGSDGAPARAWLRKR